MKRQFTVEVTCIGTAVVTVDAETREDAMQKAEELTTVMHAGDWNYDATNVRETWFAETPDESMILNA